MSTSPAAEPALPDGWSPVREDVYATALDRTLRALEPEAAISRLTSYYDLGSGYAGTLFQDVGPNDAYGVGAADLYALTTLSIRFDAPYARKVLGDESAEVVRPLLEGLPTDLRIASLVGGGAPGADALARMYDLHSHFRGLLGGRSNRWVTAAKLCARKRPALFPVRDQLVCEYLAGGRPLRSGDGRPGDFAVDIQVYARLMDEQGVAERLEQLRNELVKRETRPDEQDLRLLDTALWTAAKNGVGQVPA